MSTVSTEIAFFEYLFGNDTGYVCIATTLAPAKRDTFRERYFDWPKQKRALAEFIESAAPQHNVYFCVNLLSEPKRLKTNALEHNLVWADLDSCPPDTIEIPPQCVIESSPNRYQAVWKLDSKIDPYLAENYSRRVAYMYAAQGADKSGHDLTQLLRVPGTLNFKYHMEDGDPPTVALITNLAQLLPVDVFSHLPDTAAGAPYEDLINMPDVEFIPPPESVIYAFQERLKTTAFAHYYSEEPVADWSRVLWRLLNTCFEVGMTAEETFSVARSAKCNKYARDGRPEAHLWREVIKAELQHKSFQTILGEQERILTMPQLLGPDDVTTPTIIDQYKEWAITATDAVPEFHELSCAVLLSALTAKTLRLHSSLPFKLVPNIWGLVLGDSSLTRKTTAMEMAMDFIKDIDRELVVATDASAEGIISALEDRPRMVSIFYRDEISGLLEIMKKRDYLAGLSEILAKMYDVPSHYSRRLSRKTVSVAEPIFIFFGGGILDKTYSLIDEQYFLSGFLPRFLMVTGRADIDRIKPTGPPLVMNEHRREDLLMHFRALHTIYTTEEINVEAGGQLIPIVPEVEVTLTFDAWTRFAEMETVLVQTANESLFAEKALPSFQRMAFSMLKLAMLLAASRQGENKVLVETQDLINAAGYIQKWGRHYIDMIRHSGQGHDEQQLQSIYRTIERHPGILRGALMTRHYLNKRTMDEIQETLDQRGMVHIEKKGKGAKFWPIGR